MEGSSVVGVPKRETKRKQRKNSKQSVREPIDEYYYDLKLEREYEREYEREEKQPVMKQRKSYENIQYLSKAERKQFEEKFTTQKNGSQKDYVNILSNKNRKIVVATGPAGTGKTMFATEFGVKNFLLGQYEKLIFTRPSVSVDEDLGYLPGTLEEKMAPWIRPIYDILYEYISPKEVTYLVEEKIIEIAPLGYMRGRTFKNCWIVADEMQNSTTSQMKMLLTRMGENSRLVVTGDLDQYDRPEITNGLEDFMNKFKGKRSSSITSVEFEDQDIMREEVVKEVLEIYSAEVAPAYQLTESDESGENTPSDNMSLQSVNM